MRRIASIAMLFLLCVPQIAAFAEGRFDLSGPNSGEISCNQQEIPLPFLSVGHKIAVLSLLSPSPDAWRAEIHTTKQTLKFDPRAPGIGFLDWRTIMFDVPSDFKVTLLCPEGNPKFRFIGYIDEFNKQEALFDRDWPKPLTAKEVAPYKIKADALGTLRNVDAKSRTWSDCNAVRVAKGYWLTNVHCFASKAAYEALVADQFGFVTLNGMDPSGPISMITRPVARGRIVLSLIDGQTIGIEKPYEYWKEDQFGPSANTRDYVVLKERGNGSDGPILPLQLTPAGDNMLASLQWWRNDGSDQSITGSFQVKVDTGPLCVVVPQGTTDRLSFCPAPLLPHRCGTHGASSGSPLLDRSTGRVVALHFLGAASGSQGMVMDSRSKNCSLPAVEIINDLKANGKEVLAKILASQ